MNKAELVDKLAQRTGVSHRDARGLIDAIFDPDPAVGLIAAVLVRGEKVAWAQYIQRKNHHSIQITGLNNLIDPHES